MRRLGNLLGCLVLAAAACGGTEPARYPSWEPTSGVVPEQPDRELAERELEQSRRIWVRQRLGRYTYVRGRQLSKQHVEFTLLVVDGPRVVRRSLLTADLPAYDMRKHGLGLIDEPPRVAWNELGSSVGSHADGAPPLTIDQLYQLCRTAVLGRPSEHAPRLFFHPNGVLEHCGYASDECADCPAASIASYSAFFPEAEQGPLDYVCVTHYGLFPAHASPYWPLADHCRCSPRSRRALSDPLQVLEAERSGQRSMERARWSCPPRVRENPDQCGFHGAPIPADFGKPTTGESWSPGQHRVCW